MNQPPVAKSRLKTMPKWFKVIAVLVLAALVLGAITFTVVSLGTKEAVRVGNRVVHDVQANDPADFYSLTSSGFRGASSQQDVSDILERTSPNLQGTVKMESKTLQKHTGSPQEAIIVYSVSTASGKKYIRLGLVKNDKWQIQDYRSADQPLKAQDN